MSYLDELDRIKAALEAKHPGWAVWYVPQLNRGVTWCARRTPTLNEDSPEHLSEAIVQVEAEAQPGS